MPLTLDWSQFAARLFFTILAGALIGWDRGEQGHPAGLRTTLLVCLAASVAMIESNALLDTRGKPEDSFVVLDLMRLPLGILSGIGFIGAGAIIRRGDMVLARAFRMPGARVRPGTDRAVVEGRLRTPRDGRVAASGHHRDLLSSTPAYAAAVRVSDPPCGA